MKYIANPVEVEARRIVGVETDVSPNSYPPGFQLELEDGAVFSPAAELVARMVPAVGDYVVTQADGYVYLNPKDVFERKYRPARVDEDGKAAS